MATPGATRTCLRTLSSPRNLSTSPSVSYRTASRPAHRTLHTTASPLYLDFLAPCWQQQRQQQHHQSHQGHIRSQSTLQIRSANLQSPSRAQPSLQTQQSPHRNFSTSARQSARAITNARKDESGEELHITITPRAAHRLQAIAAADNNPALALRVSVESGGCHGFQYLMSLTSVEEADAAEDTVFEHEEVVGGSRKGEAAQGSEGEQPQPYRAKVVMDEASLDLLKGSSVDYTMELIGSQFKVTGIPGATSSCGCGTSFDIAA